MSLFGLVSLFNGISTFVRYLMFWSVWGQKDDMEEEKVG